MRMHVSVREVLSFSGQQYIYMYLLGYDIGSSSVKASLVDSQSGKCVASAFYPKSEAPILAVCP